MSDTNRAWIRTLLSAPVPGPRRPPQSASYCREHMQQGACTAVSSASNMPGTCVYTGARFGSRRDSGV